MKILVVSQNFWPENFRINDVVLGLSKLGVDIDILTGVPNYPLGIFYKGYKFKFSQEYYKEIIKIYRIPIIPRGKKSSYFGLLFNYLSFIFFGILYGVFNKKLRGYDLIFVYAPSPILQAYVGIFISYFNKVPIITWVQDLWPESLKVTGYIKNKLILSFVKLFVRDIYKRNTLLLTSSKSFNSEIKKIYDLTPIKYFPNPPEQLKIDKNKKYSFIKNDKFNILFAGNLGKAQGLETVIEAAELIKEDEKINIILLGEGNISEYLLNQIKEKKLTNVQMPGRYDIIEMGKIYSDSSALLISLKKNKMISKTVPGKFQSYLSAGKPIIGSIDGAVSDIIKKEKIGICCSSDEPQLLALTILEMSKKDKKELDHYSSNAIKYYNKNYNPEKLFTDLKKIFELQIKK